MWQKKFKLQLITYITRPLDAMVDSPRSNHNHNKIQNKVDDQENGCCWFWPSRSHEALEVWSMEIARGKLNAATLVGVQVQDRRELYSTYKSLNIKMSAFDLKKRLIFFSIIIGIASWKGQRILCWVFREVYNKSYKWLLCLLSVVHGSSVVE